MLYFNDLAPISCIFYLNIYTQNAASKIGQRQFEYEKLETEIPDEQMNKHFQQFIVNFQEAYNVNGQEIQDSDDESGDIFAHVITTCIYVCMYIIDLHIICKVHVTNHDGTNQSMISFEI